ncbi:MAG: ubiquinol oxidase subunit II [Candidatus Thiodiazotropha sp.]
MPSVTQRAEMKSEHHKPANAMTSPIVRVFLLCLIGVATSAHAGDLLTLEPRGPIAGHERDLIVITLSLMLLVVIPVFAMTTWFAWHYRAGNAEATYAPEWTSHRVDLVIWLVPTLIVAVLATLTWDYTHRLNPYKPIAAATAPLDVQVVALDWKWLFIYPQQGIATVNRLVIPSGRPVTFDITSDTVMNAFFIPQLGGQIYAMAGMRTQLNLLADKPGKYFGENTQYSGRGFPYQTFTVEAKPQQGFDRWVKQQQSQHTALNWDGFKTLAKPSVNDPVRTFGKVDAGLFDRIMAQYASDRKTS